MTELKYCKTSQENVSLSLAKRKLDEKSEWKFSYQSGDVMYASIYLIYRRKSFFFSVPYIECDFMIAKLVRLNLAVLKILEKSQ